MPEQLRLRSEDMSNINSPCSSKVMRVKQSLTVVPKQLIAWNQDRRS